MKKSKKENKTLFAVHQAFAAWDFNQVLELIETHSEFKSTSALLPVWIGALVFTGNLEKALALFKKNTLSLDQTIACRFFLAIGYIRRSDYSQGRALLITNLRLKNKTTSLESLFFIFQGIAFYRFFCGQFYQSKKYATLAYEASAKQTFTFGEMMSKDLLAHSLIQLGQIRKGLKYFEDTLKTVQRAKNQWLSAAIEISVLKFRAQFGLNPLTDLVHLQKALKELSSQDTYSVSELLLEITRQQLLRGHFKDAEQSLSQASDIIYKHQNRRQMAVLNIRMSYMLYLQAQYTQALHVIRFAEQNIDQQVDLALWNQIGGLKQMILKASGRTHEAEQLHLELLEKKLKSQTAINNKILARTSQQKSTTYNPGEDSLGDLLDKIHSQSADVPKLIVEKKYYGLLHKYYKLPFGTQALIFDLIPGSVVILDKGNVTFKQKGINTLFRKILLLVREEPQSKEQLIESVWGYQYDPLRHDPLIYSTINKIRKMLEDYSDWIVLTEEGYRIRSDVKVIFKNSLKMKTTNTVVRAKTLPASHAPLKQKPWQDEFKHLNFRQLQIVDYLKENASLSISELATKLDISKPTATRDLSQLYSIGILKRAGKGRATRYFIQ